MRTMQSELVEKNLAANDPPQLSKKKPTEKFSRRELEELMGVRRPTYIKRHGAFRSK